MRQIESRKETNKKRGKVIHMNKTNKKRGKVIHMNELLTRGHSLLFAKPDREGGKQCEQCKVVQRQKSAALHLLGISFFACNTIASILKHGLKVVK